MLNNYPTPNIDYDVRTPLRDAIDSKDVRRVRATLKRDGIGEGLGLRLAAGDAMTLWINGGSPAILKALLAAGMSEPYTDACLGAAVDWGVVDAVRMLIAAGVSESARGKGLVVASEWMRDRAMRGARVSPTAHAEIVRMLLTAGTTKSARDDAVGKAATYGDAWMCWMLRDAGVSAKAITEARRQAKKYHEEGVEAVLKRGDVEEPPVRRPARFDIYFAKSGRKRDALINEISRAYGAAFKGHEDADRLIAEVRAMGEQAAVSQMMDVEVGDRDTAREIAERWMRCGGISPLLGTRTEWEFDEAVEWREAIRVGRY